jgi:hypothetical protein
MDASPCCGANLKSSRPFRRVESVTTREALAPSVHVRVGRERDSLHVLGTGQLTGPPGCVIFRIARDPEGNEVVPPSERGDQDKCASCVAITPMRYINRIADLTGIES